jgi:hypothetical protein
MSNTKKKSSSGMEEMRFPCISSNQNQTPILGLKTILAPKEEASKVNLWGCTHV